MTQPEALRLADLLEQIDGQYWQVQDSAAAELRRLHAENERLRQIVEDFPPIEAELHDVSDRAHQLAVQRNALLAQRDALLAACRMAMMLRHLGGMLPGSREIVEEIVKAASAAIAKAEENT